MKILAIESSCDETAAAVVESGTRILSNVVVSQVDIFAAYGGVIPEVAARSHLEAILPVVHKALDDAKLTKDDIDAIAVTHTPGLLGSLLIGTLTARVLAILWDKPLYAVHHLKSHIYANWLSSQQFRSTISSEDRSSRQPAVAGVARPAFSVVTCESSSDERLPEIASTECQQLKLTPAQGQVAFESGALGSESIATSPMRKSESSKSQRGYVRGTFATAKPEILASESDARKSDSEPNAPGLRNNCREGVPEFPLLALVVSGGHTQIIYMSGHNQFEIIGTTRDDAVGECFDKVAKILGLPYPGGPSIAKAALQGDAKKYKLPHPQVDGLDFSFSGLKTAVLRAVQAECGLPITTPSYELKDHLTEQQKADFAASFQETACEILMEKVKIALRGHQEVKSLVIAGGVSANAVLRQEAVESLQKAFQGKIKVYFPDLKFAGDNAAMVGAAAYFEIVSGVEPTNPYTLSIAPRTAISEN